jgi:hypothetical protein
MAEGTNVYIPSESRISFAEEASYNASPVQGAQTYAFNITNEDISLPDPEVEQTVLRSVGAGANPSQIVAAGRTLSGNIPMVIQNGRILKYCLGACANSGSNPYTHDISCTSGKPDSLCIENVNVDDGSNEWVRYYTGVVVTGMELKAEEEGFLSCSIDIEAALAQSSTNTASTVETLTDEPFQFCSGQMTYFGSVYARVLSFNLSVKRAFKARRYINTTNCGFPQEINMGARDIEMSTTVVAANDVATYGTAYYAELLDPTVGGTAMELLFTRGVNDTIKVTLTGAALQSSPHTTNPEGEDMPVDLSLLARDVDIQVIDATATY